MENKMLRKCYICSCLFLSLLLMVGCKENIDDSNFAIKTEMSIADIVSSSDDLSMMKEILERVPLGNSDEASSMLSVLSTRGNYTIFLPDNSAILEYLQENQMSSIDELSEEDLHMIANNSIIDTQNRVGFETASFPVKGFFNVPCLNDRLLQCSLDDEGMYVINGKAKVIKEDLKASNGFAHIVDHVISMSNKTVDRLIMSANNMSIFSALLKQTSWADSLHRNMDLSYEKNDRPQTVTYPNLHPFKNAQHRYLGYTIFAEPDSVYETEWNVKVMKDEDGNLTNWEEIYPVIKKHCESVYGTMDADSLKSPHNAVNQFVAYHLLEGKMAYDKLVRHFNEYGYKNGDPNNPQTVDYPVNVWAYFTTMGQHRGLLKITQVGDGGFEHDMEHRIYLNRISIYANGPTDDYRELGVADGCRGILIEAMNGENDNNGLNGYYYPIDHVLFYADDFRNKLFNERIRMDVSTMLPELMSNNVRGVEHTHFENGYFDNITNVSSPTVLLYLMTPGNLSWTCYQGDQFMALGLFDFTMKLPPVPMDGTYEIRMAVGHNPYRGMAQIYFGDNPLKMMPAGLPYDMRQQFEKNSATHPYYEDTDDWTINLENDKRLRNQGYMRGMNYCMVQNGKANRTVRADKNTNRKVLLTADMKANKTYYIRFKSALKKTDSQFFIDYFEYASSRVYNSSKSEDIW